MRKKENLGVSAVLVLLFLCFMVLICKDNASAKNKKMIVEDELLIQFSIDTPRHKANAALNAHGASVADEIQQLRIKRIKVPAHVREVVREALSHNPHVEFVENNFLAEASGTPNDSLYPSQWHLPKIDAPSGWDISSGSTKIPIAIIDSGVDPAHPDLAGKLIAGYNFVGNNTDTQDVLGHGTAVAGTAAAMTNNVTGVAGLACDNPIMPLVVLNADRYASYYDIARAITYAVDRGVKVLNISIGGSSSSSTLQSGTDYAWNKGALIFASAMNFNTSTPYYPAACPNVVAVSATTSSDTKASFSNYGTWVDIAAPGEYIYTTKNGGSYSYWSGTSFASPLTAGLAALIWSANPSLTNAQVYDILTQNTDDLGTLGYDQYFGFGRINALKSLLAAIANEPDADKTAPVVSIATPSSNITISGFISVSVSASDNVGVSKVELYINNTLFATDSSSPFSFIWDTTKYANTTHTLKALAYDSAGNVGQSASVTVSVSNADTTAPSASITSPANNVTVSGVISVSASASDNVGVSKVELYINGALFATDSSTPFSFTWDTTKYANGAYTLSARAYDNAGNVGQSASVTVTVLNNEQDTIAPKVTITSPPNGSTIAKKVTVRASASDNIAVTKLELYINGVMISVTNTSSLSYNWNTNPASNGSHTITAKAYDGAGNVGVHNITVYK